MDEYIDIVTSEGLPTGKSALKSKAHKNGWYHNTVHLWLFTKKRDVLLQQRSNKKLIHPLLWDVSVAGHIDSGETFVEAAIRECKEEIGLTVESEDLIHIGTSLHKSEYNGGTIKDYEFHQIYISEFEGNLEKLKIQHDEVEAVKLVDFEKFEELLINSQTNHHFIASNSSYYRFVIKEIQNHLSL